MAMTEMNYMSGGGGGDKIVKNHYIASNSVPAEGTRTYTATSKCEFIGVFVLAYASQGSVVVTKNSTEELLNMTQATDSPNTAGFVDVILQSGDTISMNMFSNEGGYYYVISA